MPRRKVPSVLLFLLILNLLDPTSAASTNATCPLDLSYVATFPWDSSSCETLTNVTNCCQTLLSLLGIGLAEHLRTTGIFRLSDAATSASCISEYQSKLSSLPLSLSSNLTSICFTPGQFAITPNFCAGIQNTQDWDNKLGNKTGLNSACDSDLNDSGTCLSCYTAGVSVITNLTKIDGNSSHSTQCFYLTILYVAGIANKQGPYYPPTAKCIFGLAIKSSNSNSTNTNTNTNSNSKSNQTVVIASSVSGAILLLILVSLTSYYFIKKSEKRKRKIQERENEIGSGSKLSYPRPNTGSMLFDIKELKKATNNFSPSNLIGRGGFGVVYKGILSDGSQVAVKQVLDPNIESNDEEFRNEVEIISKLRHRNLVPLRGCCISEDDMNEGKQFFLLYDYMPNGSLERYIFTEDESKTLTWAQRKTIILDIAKGLEYLHYGVKPGIYHRDIKATNILLDEELRAKVADFGLARQSREGQSHLTTRVAGTHGYLAPEYALYGQLTEKSDVYSFGVLILEILTSRHALDMSSSSGVVLVTDWAWTLVKAGQTSHVLDKRLFLNPNPNPNFNPELNPDPSPRGRGVMERFVLVGILCAHVMVALRPTIVEALRMLEGDLEVPEIPDRPIPLGLGFGYGDIGGNVNLNSNLNSNLNYSFFASPSPAESGPSFGSADTIK